MDVKSSAVSITVISVPSGLRGLPPVSVSVAVGVSASCSREPVRLREEARIVSENSNVIVPPSRSRTTNVSKVG